MKAIKLIIVTIIQFYASMLGIEDEEKKPDPIQPYIIHMDSNDSYSFYYYTAPGVQDKETYLWVNKCDETTQSQSSDIR